MLALVKFRQAARIPTGDESMHPAALAEVQDPGAEDRLASAGMVSAGAVAGTRGHHRDRADHPGLPSKDAIAEAVGRPSGACPASRVEVPLHGACVAGRTPVPAPAGRKNIIAVAAGKGGVGKSTVTTNWRPRCRAGATRRHPGRRRLRTVDPADDGPPEPPR